MSKFMKNKGALFITTLMVTVVLFVLAGAYLTSLIVQKQLVERQRLSQQAFYAAEKGIEYAFIESQNHNWSWLTSEVMEPKTYLVNRPAPDITISGAKFNDNCTSAYNDRCYYLELSSFIPGASVQVKTYADPDEKEETIVLSRGWSGAVSRLLKFRISKKSIFSYFYFYPQDKWFWSMNFSGRGRGGIYVRGDIYLYNTNYNDITELMTRRNGSINKAWYTYVSPEYLDNLLGGKDGKAPLPSLEDPHIFTLDEPYPWHDWRWPPYGWPPGDWQNVDRHFLHQTSTGSVNGVTLPTELNRSWTWYKYGTETPAEAKVKFVYYENGEFKEPDDSYWKKLEEEKEVKDYEKQYGKKYFDEDFWKDKTYKSTNSSRDVKFLNTWRQNTEWRTWLDNQQNIKNVIKEGDRGKDLSVVNIKTNFSKLAKDNGLYIGKDNLGEVEVYLNGSKCTGPTCLPSWIKDNVQFFNTVRTKGTRVEGYIKDPEKENVLQFDIDAGLSQPDRLPNNGIIYIAERNSMIVNGAKLPKNGLTLVSPYNFYLMGNYNQATWQPSAIITNSMVYFISDYFNYPKTLPATIYPRMYPYELENIDLNNFPQPGDSPKVKQMKLMALESECKSFFGLGGLDLLSLPPANLNALQDKIRTQYNIEYRAQMPNKADYNKYYYVAIASPYEPTGYQLERWYKEGYSQDQNTWNYRPYVIGAFAKLGYDDKNNNGKLDPGEGWAFDTDVPDDYWGRRAGGPNSKNEDPLVMPWYATPPLVVAATPDVGYEDRFSPERTPPGGFFAGSEEYWEELTSTDQNFMNHIPTVRSPISPPRGKGGEANRQGAGQGPPGIPWW